MTAALLLALACSRIDWQVNENRALTWGGVPYIPVGLEMPANPDAIAQAAKSGIKDVLLDVDLDGTGWEKAFKACDAAGMRYMVTLTSTPPTREAVAVDPAGYRLPDIERKTLIDFAMPGVSEALLVLASQRDGNVRWSRRVPIVNGRLRETIDPEVLLPHVLLIYPLVKSLEAPDFFDGLDAHRDKLLASFAKSPPGPGFRGLINPLGVGLVFPDNDSQCVPTSTLFRAELANALEQKYAKVATAVRAWGVSANDISDFGQMARLVPLWSETRGVSQLWDTQTDRLYAADKKASVAWTDIRSTLRAVALRRTKHLIENLKEQTHAPIIASYSGWHGPYVSPDIPLTGIAMSVPLDSVQGMMDAAALPVSTQLRLDHPSVALAVGLVPGAKGLTPQAAVDELEGMGVRGWFFKTTDPAAIAAVAKLATEKAADTSASEWKITGLFYPDAARDPAQPMRLVGGLWWLPSPVAGQRILFGAGIEGYRDDTSDSPVFALWSDEGNKKVQLRLTDSKRAIVTTVDGQPVAFKRRKDGIELELGTQPVLVMGVSEVPVPTVSMSEVTTALTVIMESFENQVNQSGNESFAFSEAVKGFDRAPGASFMAARSQLTRLLPRAAPYVWIAASRSQKHNFGEASNESGSASGSVLVAGTRLAPAEGELFAEFPLNVKRPDSYEVWLSARIPSDLRDKVRMEVNGRLLGPPERPVSFYGNQLAWYKFGTADLPKGTAKLRFQCPTLAGVDLALDVVHLATPGFRPNGPRMPMEWLKLVPKPKKPDFGKGLGG